MVFSACVGEIQILQLYRKIQNSYLFCFWGEFHGIKNSLYSKYVDSGIQIDHKKNNKKL